MRVLVVSDEAARRRALAEEVRRAGHEVGGAAHSARVVAETRRVAPAPEALLLKVEDQSAATRVVGRVRLAAEARLPALVVLPAHATWLRSGAPEIGRALERLGGSAMPVPGERAGALALDRRTRHASGPGGAVALTPSEASILARLIAARGAIVDHGELSAELWQRPLLDRHSPRRFAQTSTRCA